MCERGLGTSLGGLSARQWPGYLQLSLVSSGTHPHACQMEAVDRGRGTDKSDGGREKPFASGLGELPGPISSGCCSFKPVAGGYGI